MGCELGTTDTVFEWFLACMLTGVVACMVD